MKFLSILIFYVSFSYAANAASFNDALAAAGSGDPQAQLIVGISYHFGEYGDSNEKVGINPKKAIRWLTAATNNEHCFSLWFLGGLYHEGNGIDKNEEQAAKYFLLAAQRGNIKAQRNIAVFYYYGMSVPQNFDIAYAWISVANYQQRGHKNTQALLNMIIPKLKNREAADTIAASYLEKYGKPHVNCGNT